MPLTLATVADSAAIIALQNAAVVADPATYGANKWDAAFLTRIYRGTGRERLILYRDNAGVLRGMFSGYRDAGNDAAVISYVVVDTTIASPLQTMINLYKTWAQNVDGVSQLTAWVKDGGKLWTYAQAHGYTVLATRTLDDGNVYHLIVRPVVSGAG